MPVRMEPMSEAADQQDSPARRVSWLRAPKAARTRRTLLLTALGGLLIAGLVTAVPSGSNRHAGLLGHLGADAAPNTGGKGVAKPAGKSVSKGNEAIDRAARGDCLMWPDNTLDEATVVDCAAEHKFEVAGPVDMRTFPGSEYGPDADPPSAARIEQITQEQCESAVSRYLGPKFDPHSKFLASMLWSGDTAWRQYGQRRMLCGLQLPGSNDQQLAFTGRVAEVDQSKIWPAGTCLGIDPETSQPNDVPVDCAAPHTKEVTGTVNLAEKFPDALPPEPEQDTLIKETCTRLTDAYLAPVQLRNTTLTLTYDTVSLPSWSAGSREVACSIGATLGDGGWATLVNSARGPLLINGQPPIPPPEIPAERLNLLPPIPLPTTPAAPRSAATTTRPENQHLPQQQPAPRQAPAAPQPQAPPPQAAPPLPPQAQPPEPPPPAAPPLFPWLAPPPPPPPPSGPPPSEG